MLPPSTRHRRRRARAGLDGRARRRPARNPLGGGTTQRTRRHKHNRIAQDHRDLKQRYSPLRGFGTFDSAARCCPACEEHRHYFRAQARSGEPAPLAERRRRSQDRWTTLMAAMAAA